MSSNGNKCCCGGKKVTLVLMSIFFMVAMSYIYGALLALPASAIVYYCVPGIFGSFAQAFFCITFSFALLFLAITVLSRICQISLEGAGYLRNTFFYDFLKQ